MHLPFQFDDELAQCLHRRTLSSFSLGVESCSPCSGRVGWDTEIFGFQAPGAELDIEI